MLRIEGLKGRRFGSMSTGEQRRFLLARALVHVQEILPEIHRVVMLKEGRVFADGSREDVLTSGTLSPLFECPLHAVWFNGTCQVYPGC